MKSFISHLLSVLGYALHSLICLLRIDHVKEIGSGSASYMFCFHLVDIPIRHKRLVFTILISVLTCSISCAYHSGNVSLSPIVNRMALGAQELRYALAIAVAVYFPERSWSSQFGIQREQLIYSPQ
jgi:L-asparagine transporter-like permease